MLIILGVEGDVVVPHRMIVLVAVLLLVLAACDTGSDEPPTATLEGAKIPTRIPTDTPTSTSTNTPTPTNTPTATVTPSPTNTTTPTATFTPSNTPTITSTPTPLPIIYTIGDDTAFSNTDAVNASTSRVVYEFNGSEGDVVNLSIVGFDDDFYADIFLQNSQGTRLVDNSETDENDTILEFFVLPDEDTYQVVVNRIEGETDGSFDFKFQRILARNVDLDASIIIEPIDDDAERVDFVGDVQPFVTYSFEGNAGDVVTIEMETLEGDLDAYLVLLNRPSRELIAEADDADFSTNAVIDEVILPADGEYLILATRYQGLDGDTEGEFRLRLLVEDE